MRNILHKSALPVSILFLLFTPALSGQTTPDATKSGLFELLSEKDMPEITITTNLDTLMAYVRRVDYVKGTFAIEGKKKEKWEIPVRLRSRGKFRRMKCNFPPLKLKFKKEDLAAQGLNEFNDFKLVTQCMKDDELAKKMLVKEYLAYKLYNELTPYSFRAQLIRVNYRHEKDSNKMRHWGIILEDADDLAHRNGAALISRMGIPLDSLHVNQEKLASTFQYMIGNCDWSYILARNVEMIQLTNGQIMPVPYDFDYCGLVNAPYSAPNVQLGQKSVKDRVYLGITCQLEEIRGIFSYFKSKEKALKKILYECKQLDEETRAEMEGYLDEFFKLLQDEEKAAAVIFPKKSEND